MRYPDGATYVGAWQGRQVPRAGHADVARRCHVQRRVAKRQPQRAGHVHGRPQAVCVRGDVAKTASKTGRARRGTPAGNTYVGAWQDGQYHGQGTLTYTDGATYVGAWQDGKRHGRGTYTSADGVNAAYGRGRFMSVKIGWMPNLSAPGHGAELLFSTNFHPVGSRPWDLGGPRSQGCHVTLMPYKARCPSEVGRDRKCASPAGALCHSGSDWKCESFPIVSDRVQLISSLSASTISV